MHSHPFNAMSPCICNVMHHCMLYHDTCIMNVICVTQSTPLTVCHGQLRHLHMTSIHHFIRVNILCTYISTSTYKMSFHVQAMTHTHNHVMYWPFSHRNSSHANTVEHTYCLGGLETPHFRFSGSPRQTPFPRRALPSPRKALPSPRRRSLSS